VHRKPPLLIPQTVRFNFFQTLIANMIQISIFDTIK
jgi:hypothetical protein